LVLIKKKVLIYLGIVNDPEQIRIKRREGEKGEKKKDILFIKKKRK
jgi:hypothetical protein